MSYKAPHRIGERGGAMAEGLVAVTTWRRAHEHSGDRVVSGNIWEKLRQCESYDFCDAAGEAPKAYAHVDRAEQTYTNRDSNEN